MYKHTQANQKGIFFQPCPRSTVAIYYVSGPCRPSVSQCGGRRALFSAGEQLTLAGSAGRRAIVSANTGMQTTTGHAHPFNFLTRPLPFSFSFTRCPRPLPFLWLFKGTHPLPLHHSPLLSFSQAATVLSVP
jgi:hypothetical protein